MGKKPLRLIRDVDKYMKRLPKYDNEAVEYLIDVGGNYGRGVHLLSQLLREPIASEHSMEQYH